jgi:hypothetical protein
VRDHVVEWLLEGDPAIGWQVMRDLQGANESTYGAVRARVADCGWGRQVLDRQDPDGLWSRSLYNGKWTSTAYSLYLLKLLGLPPRHRQALLGCWRLIEGGLYEGREIRFGRHQDVSDLGVTALVLSLCAYFGFEHDSLSAIAGYLLDRQRPDGGWQPDDSPAAADYTFETTLIVLDALFQCRDLPGAGPEGGAFEATVDSGRRFLLDHELYLESGKPIKPGWTSFSFPPYWFYDVLTALDYFQASGAPPDPGARGAVESVRNRRGSDGKWRLGTRHQGRTFFEMEPAGLSSRWVTLRALRVLAWWEGVR